MVGQRIRQFWTRYWGILLLLLIWQLLVAVNDLNTIVAPSPKAVLLALINDAEFFAIEAARTTLTASGGLALGLLLGFVTACLSWTAPVLSGLLTPAALLIRSIPVVAFVPIIVRVSGYGTHTVLIVTTFLTFFPCYVFALSGFNDVTQVRKDFCRSVGCSTKGVSGWRFFRYVAMPSAVPNILTALQLLAPTALLVALVAEFLIGSDGLGYVMIRARSDMQMDKSWAAALLASALSVIFFVVFSQLDKRYRKTWQG